jgi:hypothetical protein
MFNARNGDGRTDVMLLSDIAQAMRDASICGPGRPPPTPSPQD